MSTKTSTHIKTTRLARYEVTNAKEETRLIRRQSVPFSGDLSELIAHCTALRTGHLRTKVPAERIHLAHIPTRSLGGSNFSDLVVEFGTREGESHIVTVELERGDFAPLITDMMATQGRVGLTATFWPAAAERRLRGAR